MRHLTEKRLWGLGLCFAAALSAGPVIAAELYIYPNKRQSQEQQSRSAPASTFRKLIGMP